MNNNSLYQRLREMRNKLAAEAHVEPYMVFQNKVLEAIAEKLPVTVEELAAIKGMGEKKLAKYAVIILQTLQGSSKDIAPHQEEEKNFSVSEYIDALNTVLRSQRAVLRGEIGAVDNRGGYTFFTLLDTDNDGMLNCLIWQDVLEHQGIDLKEGLEIHVEGYPDVYKKSGRLTFRIQRINLVGEGALRLAFEKLKKKLATEGYFRQDRKKPILPYVHAIGLITSQYGDAIKDFLTHVGTFGYRIHFFDVRVEGVYAVGDIVSAIRWFNESGLPLDVLVLIRGGGSLESLQAFNSEDVARAIFASKTPVLTGIGHENDTTIADLVADVRASTPTAAGKILSDPWRNTEDFLKQCQKNMLTVFSGIYHRFRQDLVRLEEELVSIAAKHVKAYGGRLDSVQAFLEFRLKSIIDRVKHIRQQFLENRFRLENRLSSIRTLLETREIGMKETPVRWLQFLQTHVRVIEQKLVLSDPTARLKQGYSIVRRIDSTIIKSSDQLTIGDMVRLSFFKGSADSKVENIHK